MRSIIAWVRYAFCLGALFSCLICIRGDVTSKTNGPVYLILWFDTEDYMLPASDDSAKRLAELLTRKGVRATFKVVGEKARTLERRGRGDVIAALKKHDIGYHANFHSVHPTPTEYLAETGFLDGEAEFVRREGGGARDVRRIFDVPTLACYGQPGSSWGAQAIAGLKEIGVAPHGVPCYVDEGNHVGLREQPFWYENALVVYHMGGNYTRMDLHDPSEVEPAKRKATEIADRLRAQGGGLISIFYHPCEWVHKEFWDGVNFRRGANPPREEWKAPPQRTAEETEAAFARFSEYIDHLKSIPGIQFITASELPGLYQDSLRDRPVSEQELVHLAGELQKSESLNFLQVDGRYWSVADQFEALAHAVAGLITHSTAPVRVEGVFGPSELPPKDAATHAISWPAFRDSTLDAEGFCNAQKQIPSRVFVGADAISPADFLVGMANAYAARIKDGHFPASVNIGQGLGLETQKNIAQDTPNLFGGWIIHKEGFRAPKVLEIARLQTWTLKPAVLAPLVAK